MRLSSILTSRLGLFGAKSAVALIARKMMSARTGIFLDLLSVLVATITLDMAPSVVSRILSNADGKSVKLTI